MPELKLARKLHIAGPDRGHQTTGYLLPQTVIAAAWLPALLGRRRLFPRMRGGAPAQRGDWGRLITLVGDVFPSMAFLARQPRTIVVWHPRGPHETEMWRWFLVDKDAPDEVKDFLRRLLHPLFRSRPA